MLTALAMYLVFRKISWQETWKILRSLNVLWLIGALILFNLSQSLSARRIRFFYTSAGAGIPPKRNLWLYYQGMFYNLFLPGGVGGDGYKIHFLYKQYAVPVKRLVTASLLDRLNGLAALGFLAVLFAGSGLIPNGILGFASWMLIPLYVILCGAALWVASRYFRRYFPVLGKTTLLSVGVQMLQLSAVVCLLAASGSHDHEAAYLLLFLISSVAAAIPFTIGGAGAREIVFMAGAPLLGVLREEAVAISLLFFLITALSSLPGVLLPAPEKRLP